MTRLVAVLSVALMLALGCGGGAAHETAETQEPSMSETNPLDPVVEAEPRAEQPVITTRAADEEDASATAFGSPTPATPSARVVAARGLARAGQPVSVLEVEAERYPRVAPAAH